VRPRTQHGSQAPSAGGEPSWQQTTWGKTVIGLIVAQGLWYTLMMLARTVVSATGNDVQAWLSSFSGLILMQGMLLVSLVVGGMLAGAGQQHGTLNGTIVGVCNAVFFVLVYVMILKNETLGLFVLLMLQVAFGTAGGFFGMQIWKPIEALTPLPETGAETRDGGVERILSAAAKKQKPSLFAGPVNWLRVVPGAVVAVVGTISAPTLFRYILMLGGPDAQADSQAQVKLLTFQLSALAMLAGGTIAGSNSNNGFKQGLVVGILSSLFLIGALLYQGDSHGTETVSSFFKQVFGIEVSENFQKILFTVLAVLPLSMAGSWFGSQLLPPLIIPPRRKRMLPTMS
jgi:hypothetical protein